MSAATPKLYKALQIAGVLLILIGVVVRVDGEIYGTGIAVLGVLLYAAGRIGAWWKTG
jgi:hypothetical protein